MADPKDFSNIFTEAQKIALAKIVDSTTPPRTRDDLIEQSIIRDSTDRDDLNQPFLSEKPPLLQLTHGADKVLEAAKAITRDPTYLALESAANHSFKALNSFQACNGRKIQGYAGSSW